jgi:hypothetical protein
VTAEAARTCAGTARYLAGDCHAGYPLTAKGHRAPLHTAGIATGRDLAAAEPGHIAEERGHGRINRWTTPDHLHRPHGLRMHRPAARHMPGGHPPRRRRTWPDSRSARRSCSRPPAAPV